MKCKEANELLERYLEGDLDEKSGSCVEAHLRECGNCAADLAFARQILEAAKAQPVPAPPDDYWAGFITGLHRRISGKMTAGIYSGINTARVLRIALPVFAAGLLLIFLLAPRSTRFAPVAPTAPQAPDQPATGTKINAAALECLEPALKATQAIEDAYCDAVMLEEAVEQKTSGDFVMFLEELTEEERTALKEKISNSMQQL